MKEKLRLPAVAGQFYPEDKKELEQMIDNFLDQAVLPEIGGDIFGLLLPHAGYVYSGPVAAHGFKAISGKSFETVIILGDSHYERFDGVSIWPEGFWETPLGRVEVDDKLTRTLIDGSDRFFTRDSTHLFEHSLETQLPFLQKILKNFKIVPIIFGSEDEDWQLLAQTILKNIKNPSTQLGAGKNILIIASADLSHYLPYEEAKEIDKKTLKNILNLQTQDLEVCAKDSVKTLIEIAKNLGCKSQLLKYANSGDTAAGKAKVVGYGAVAFHLPRRSPSEEKEKTELLHIARTSLESFIKEGKIPEFGEKRAAHEGELLASLDASRSGRPEKSGRGVFVTLKKHGELRGCIGCMVGDRPLYQIVSRMALAAALEDPRFPPVTEGELPELEYEISILSPPRKINSPREIQLGIHGVQVVAGLNSGLFLPQVATENNWDLETFLDNLMLKAGLPPNHWRENAVDFYTFEAEVLNGQ